MTEETPDDWLLGHEPLPRRLNVRAELRRLARDPLEPLLQALGSASRVVVLQDEFSRYRDTYACYYLSLRRFLPAMSLAVRWSNGPYWKRRYGGKYTPAEQRLAREYNKVAPYLYLDFYTCLLWARILLDRVVAFSRHFIDEPVLPSFTSFADHKRFFVKLRKPYGQHEAYASYLREMTGWFDAPLKLVRDKYIVHASPKHSKFFGYPAGGHELQLSILIPAGDDPAKPMARVRMLNVGIPQMAREIERFLTWYAEYGRAQVRRKR